MAGGPVFRGDRRIRGPLATILGSRRRSESRRPGAARELTFRACARDFVVSCPDPETTALLVAGFSGLAATAGIAAQASSLRYRVDRVAGGGFCLSHPHHPRAIVPDADSLLYQLDKCFTLALQRERPDLYFLHAAAVAAEGNVAVLAAPSGTGKSTLTFALLASGMRYLSDELAPIDISRRLVYPYPHALSLKSPPPAPYHLPPDAIALGRRFHVPAAAVAATDPLPLRALVFVERSGMHAAGSCRQLSAAAASARIMANALNPSAHLGEGLDGAVELSRCLPCFVLDTTDLCAACAAVERILS